MKYIFNLPLIFLLLIACVPIPVVEPTMTKPFHPQEVLASVTPSPTNIPALSFTSTPTLSPFPTLSDDYYSTPSKFELEYIKMFDEVNGWGWADYVSSISFSRLVRTSDGGKSWIDVTPVERLGVVRDFFLDSKTAWISSTQGQINSWTLYFTDNGGLSWKALSAPPEGINSLYFIDRITGWIVSGSHVLYQTTDGGQTWNKFLVNSLIEDYEILFRGTANIWTINDDPTIPAFNNLYVSWDEGSTWEIKSMPLQHEIFSNNDLVKVNLPVFFGDKLGYVAAQYFKQTQDAKPKWLMAIFVTNDGGHTWTQLSSVAQKLWRPDYLDFISPDVAFTACEVGLCITKDGAKTWQVVQLDKAQKDIFNEIDSFDVNFVTELKGWFLTWKIGVGTNLYFTDNGGKTWIPLPIKIYRSK